jgi:alkylation response protein AidB-like acyl-CoA dehydrogenase
MKFSFSANQLAFRDAFRELLDRECTPDVARESHVPELWKRVGEMGVLGIRRELDEVDLVLLLEEAGRALLPGPFLATAAVGVPALTEAGQKEWLDPVSSGDAVLAIGLQGEPVAFADVADVLLLGSDGVLHAVPRDRVQLERVQSFSRARPRFRVHWEPTDSERLDVSVEEAFERAALAAAAEAVGVASRLIDMGAEYAKQREQFGAPIGSFQAVKHLLANALVKLEFARPAVYAAAWSLAEGVPDQARAVSLAKAMATDATMLAARNSLQVHGAIGYTEEHHLHLWLKAAWALGLAYGDATWHRTRVAESVVT